MTMTMTTTLRATLLSCALLPWLSSCTLEGEIEVRIWGEEFIEEGIPADALADGWAINFERFELDVRELDIAEVSFSEPGTYDLTEPSSGRGQSVASTLAATGDYSDASFTLANVEVVGSATKDGVTKQFSWSFPTAVSYSNCETTTTVSSDESSTFEITVHADHLFYDSFASEDPALRFEALAAADADGDDTITEAELEAAALGAYDPGNLDIANLWQFLTEQAATMGHVDGEGHCDAST